MNANHQLTLLKALLKSYFSEKLEHDETPAAARRRLNLRKAIIKLTKDEN